MIEEDDDFRVLRFLRERERERALFLSSYEKKCVSSEVRGV